jgi:hypothetical protein
MPEIGVCPDIGNTPYGAVITDSGLFPDIGIFPHIRE